MGKHTVVLQNPEEAKEAGLNESVSRGFNSWDLSDTFSSLEMCRRFSGTEMHNDRYVLTLGWLPCLHRDHQQNGSGRMSGSPWQL